MLLFEHPEFEQAILAAEQHFRSRGLRAAVIEKDYYVTETLRAVSRSTPPEALIFKGGTSLSKGWNLIARFSEDIDLFLDPTALAPPPSANGVKRELKRLRDEVAKHPGLTLVPAGGSGGLSGRSDEFSYQQRFALSGDVVNRVLLESGTASGNQPFEVRSLQSYLGEFLTTVGPSLGASDEAPFSMRLLHFRRTFVEKLFTIHKCITLLQAEGRPLGGHARHYYDIYHLAAQPEVRNMLASSEYPMIKNDYERISLEHFPKHYARPEGMSFANSEALFPPAELASAISAEYDRQCRLLCYGPFPAWREVQDRLLELQSLL